MCGRCSILSAFVPVGDAHKCSQNDRVQANTHDVICQRAIACHASENEHGALPRTALPADGVDRQSILDLLDSEIDAFNNLIAAQCGG